MKAIEQTKLLRVDETAKLLNCSRSHIYNMIASGELCSVRFGGAVRIPSSCIDLTVIKAIERWRLLHTDYSHN